MKVLLNDKGFIHSFALVGDLVDGIEVPDPEDIDHFAEHFAAYKVYNGVAAYDDAQNTALQTEAATEEYRARREKECFAVINRGQLWYEGISVVQLLELRKWYKAWLDVTETMVVPEKPAWLE